MYTTCSQGTRIFHVFQMSLRLLKDLKYTFPKSTIPSLDGVGVWWVVSKGGTVVRVLILMVLYEESVSGGFVSVEVSVGSWTGVAPEAMVSCVAVEPLMVEDGESVIRLCGDDKGSDVALSDVSVSGFVVEAMLLVGEVGSVRAVLGEAVPVIVEVPVGPVIVVA